MAFQKQNYFQRRTKPRGPRTNERIRAPEVQVISNRDSEYLLLDPFTLQTVEAISPKDWKEGKIRALRYGNDTFFIWD